MKFCASPSALKLPTAPLLLAAFCASCSSNITLSTGPDYPPSLKAD
jgi:hypothetical protein